MNITDEDRDALLRVLVGAERGEMTDAEWEYARREELRIETIYVKAILASDVFARIVHEQAVLNNPHIVAEVAAYHADPSDVEEEMMPIEYRVVVESSVVFTSDHLAIAEGYAHGLKLRGEKGRLEVVAVGNNS